MYHEFVTRNTKLVLLCWK